MEKKAIITGSSRGIGAAIAKKFALEGCEVAILYHHHESEAKLLVKNIIKAGGMAKAYKCDVSNSRSVNIVTRKILEFFGEIDILINNAGIMINSDVLETSIDPLKKMMDTNVYPIIYFTQALASNFKKIGKGCIINIASNAGIGTALDKYTYYAVSKAAVIALTKRLAFDLRDLNIRVNAIAPGTVDTELIRSGKNEKEIKKIFESRSSKTILRRIGIPEEIASIALFLASEEASFITGQVIVADGGRFDYLSHSL